MPTALLLLTSLLLPPAQDSSAEPAAPQDGRRAYEIADYFATAMVGAPTWHPSGERLAFEVRRYDLEGDRTWTELWTMRADGSELRQLTHGPDSASSPRYSPDGEQLLFVSSRSGASQLHLLPLAGGEGVQLTRFAPGVSGPVWSPDGRWIAVTASVFPECGADGPCNEERTKARSESALDVHVADELLYRHWTSWKDGRVDHVLLVDAASGEIVRDLTPGPWAAPTFSLGGGVGYAFAPDSSGLVFVQNRDEDAALSTDTDLWLVPLEGEIDERTALNLTEANTGWDGDPVFSPDGSTLAYVSQATPGYESDLRRLALLDVATGRTRTLTDREVFDDMVGHLEWTPDGEALLFDAQREGRTPIFRIPAAGGEPRQVHVHATLSGWELSPDGETIAYTRRSVGGPPEIFRVPAGGGEPEQLTHFNDELLAEVDVRPAEELWVPGAAEGTSIQVFLVKPHDFDPERRYPLIFNVHGGPQSAWTDAYRGDWQVYPGKGYVVAFCNPTGSTGYGQDFVDAIGCDWGGRVYDDLMRVVDVLQELPYVDPERMGAMGWSYGGYMMMWFQGHTDRFVCQASMMGLFDMRSFYGATEELWFPEKDMCGSPWTSEHYERWSPSNHVEHFSTPALVITGELDYRVPYTQSLQYFTALQRQGVPSRLVVFPGAGHWPSWREMAFYYAAHLDWFHRWLGGAPSPWDVEELARGGSFATPVAETDGAATEAAAPEESSGTPR